MQLSLLARFLWAAGFLELAALMTVLLVRERWRTFPVFTAWVGFHVVKEILLYCVYDFGSHAAYATAYWSAAVIDLILQITIIFELARIILKPTGTWVRDARKMFLLLGLAGTLIAMGAAYGVSPTIPIRLSDWIAKGCLFAAMLNVQLFAAMCVASTRLGLVWHHHVMRIVTGWAWFEIVGLFAEAAYSYLGANWHGVVLDQVRIVAYETATIYWIINLWLPEPETRKLSPEMQSYLLALQKHVQVGLQSVSSLDRH
jgi:hypothetical protein